MKFRVFVWLGTKNKPFSVLLQLGMTMLLREGSKGALSLELITCPSFAYPVFEFWTLRGVYHIQREVLILKILLLGKF